MRRVFLVVDWAPDVELPNHETALNNIDYTDFRIRVERTAIKNSDDTGIPSLHKYLAGMR